MSRSMQVNIVRVSTQFLAEGTASDTCDPLNILIAAEEAADSHYEDHIDGYGDESLLVHNEPISFTR